jgi:uncharacterized protein (UPF0261 family)
MAFVALIGTLDTKGQEYEWLRQRVADLGCSPIVIDVGVLGEPLTAADVSRREVAAAAGHDIATLSSRGDRGAAIAAMAEGAVKLLRGLYEDGRLHGVLAMGGSGGSAIASRAMQALPIGVPKLLISTMASGDVGVYVGSTDITLMYSVVDIAGINRLSSRILGNAAVACTAMARSYEESLGATTENERPVIGATMFGVTTPAVDAARKRLGELGYEVLVFHATGSGGRSLEDLARDGFLDGVLDLTTTELADELVGGVLSAGAHRLEAAGARGIPQVVGPGALDMVNFGPVESVPAQFRDRKFHVHNPTVTLMRTTVEEMRELGRIIAAKLRDSDGPTVLYLPLQGVSALDKKGEEFYDPEADEELFGALREGLEGSGVEVREVDAHINDPAFAIAAAEHLHSMIIRVGA